MTINKNEKIIARILSITIIIYAFFGNVHYCCFNENFYTKEHEKITLYGKPINEHIGITKEELKELTSFTLHYLNDTKATLDKKMNINGVEREVFTDDEKLHMIDVQRLNIVANYICVFSLSVIIISVVIYIKNRYSLKTFKMIFNKVLIYTLLIFSFIVLWIIIDFDSFWTFFHHLFFAGNDLWLLDLRKDILIMIVPPQFFNDLVIKISIQFILTILTVEIIVYLLNKRRLND